MDQQFGPTLYDQLGVPRDADAQLVKRAWRAQLRATHPDTTGVDSHVQYDLVQRAGQVLTDPAQRSRYDAWLQELEAPAVQPPAPAPAPEEVKHTPEPVDEQEPEQAEPQDFPPAAPERARHTTAFILVAGLLVAAAGAALPLFSPAGSAERQMVALGALVLAGIGAWTWRTGGWRPRAMLVACASLLTVGALPYLSARFVPHSTYDAVVQVPLAMSMVVTGIGAATWRLTARRRAKYEWVVRD